MRSATTRLLTTTLFPGDTSKQFYNDSVTQLGPNPTQLSGIGDAAAWSQIVPGDTAPEVVAHQGSLTCVVQTPADTSQLTIEQTGSGPIYQISASAAATYATKMGVPCTDVFALGS